MKNKKLRVILLVLLSAVFLGSAGMLLGQLHAYRAGDDAYAEAEDLAGLTLPDDAPAPGPAAYASGSAAAVSSGTGEGEAVYQDPYADALAAMDFAALQAVNPDVLGWILIPGTKISYPILQGEDNQYYLKHTWKELDSAVGSIFLECTNRSDFSDFNTIIYGHRMNNGSMFAGLKYYKQQSYWSAHPYVYITDKNGTRKYQIFAAYEVSTQGETYRVGFSSQEKKQAFLDYCLDLSLYDTGVTPTVYDRIVTLSTCTGNGHATRWVVQARLQGAAPPAAEEPPAAAPDGSLSESPAASSAPDFTDADGTDPLGIPAAPCAPVPPEAQSAAADPDPETEDASPAGSADP